MPDEVASRPSGNHSRACACVVGFLLLAGVGVVGIVGVGPTSTTPHADADEPVDPYGSRRMREIHATPTGEVRRPRRALLAEQLSGAVRLPSVDLVLSRTVEDLDWVKDVRAELPSVNLWVYEKGRSNASASCLQSGARCVPMPRDVGRESHAYLTHVVSQYDALADKTVFAHAGAPSWGYLGPGLGGGHMTADGDFFYDFVSPLTPARVVPTFFRSTTNATMGVLKALNDRTRVGSPANAPTACDPADLWYAWEETAMPWQGKLAAQPDQMPTTREFWSRHLEAELGPLPTDRLYFANGGLLSATRDAIRARSPGLYRDLLHQVDHDADPVAGYHLEHVWGYLLGHADALRACLLTAARPASTVRLDA